MAISRTVIQGLFVSLLLASSSLRAPTGAAVAVHPGQNIQQLVDQNPPGTTFRLAAGIYRLQSVLPKDGDVFEGQQGAILSGAALIEGFEKQGDHWATSISLQSNRPVGKCRTESPLCSQPQDLFIDDKPLRRVLSVSAVVLGAWSVDESGHIFLSDNPMGHRVELSQAVQAFSGAARNVIIRGLTIEKYANPAQSGAIHAMKDPGPLSTDWVLEDNEVRWNHGGGIRLGHGTHVTRNHVHHNGQIGIVGGGRNIVVEDNEIDHNNFAGFDDDWEAGGTKFSFTENLVVRKNFVHDNDGPGLWTDGDNLNALYDGNHTMRNKSAGIFHEISFKAVIRNNVVENDGFATGKTSLWYGAGILISASSEVEVYGNVVKNCMNGIAEIQADRGSDKRSGKVYLLHDNYIHDNTVIQSAGTAAGIVTQTKFEGPVFTGGNNRFQNNTYQLANANGTFFFWMNKPCTQDEWRRYGNDVQVK